LVCCLTVALVDKDEEGATAPTGLSRPNPTQKCESMLLILLHKRPAFSKVIFRN
jgi:hypothetical protein